MSSDPPALPSPPPLLCMGTVTCEVGAVISLGGPAKHGEGVPPKDNVSRTLVRQTTGHPQWLHLNKVMALAVGRREPTRVVRDFWRVG